MFPPRRVTLSIIAVLFVAALFSGCASLPVAGPLPPGISVKKLVHVDKETSFAWHPAGDKFAFVRNDLLQIFDLKTGNTMPLVRGAGLAALDWSPDGGQLAAAYKSGEDCLLRFFNTQGKVLAESKVEGEATELMWRSADEVVVSAIVIKKFSFGANFTGVLYRWNGKAAPIQKILFSTTIKKSTAAMPKKMLVRLFSFNISPLGDEVVYTKLVDPPMFAAYLKPYLYNLETSAEHAAPVDLALSSGGAVYTADGENIVYGDGSSGTATLDPWTGKSGRTFPTPGGTIAISPANLYMLLDGKVFRDKEVVTSFPAAVYGAFSPRGNHLLLNFDNNVYLVSGLEEPPSRPFYPADKERLLLLRKWRSEGLISLPEYDAAKRKLQ